MKIKNLVVVITALMMFAQVTISMAQAELVSNKTVDNWLLLGARNVDYTLDRDVVSVEESKLSFTSLKFMVKNGTINMHKCTVHFMNGETQDIEFSNEVNKTNDGRVLELKNNTRSIEKVVFWYDTKNSSTSVAVVELWGKE
jgi:hypothetical protein